MFNIAVFASGSGSNFENIVTSNLPIEVKVLIVDKEDAKAIERARQLNIPYEIVKYSHFSKNQCESHILDVLAKQEIDFILLAGFMRILSNHFIEQYDKKIINIHPSLLPAFKGKNGIKDAYHYGVKISGVTVHYVDSGIDTGEIIDQESVVIKSQDTLEEFEHNIHVTEHKLYIRALKKILEANQ